MNFELISTIMVSDFSEDIRIRHYHHQNFPVKLQNVLPPNGPARAFIILIIATYV